MKAMIFAAGMGTRLKPVTDTLPKALVPVGGMPLIEHVSRKLRSSGIDEAVVNVHHFADMIEEWVSAQSLMSLKVSDERKRLLETGGAVLHARPYLDGCGQFLVYNVDILSDVDLNWFASRVDAESVATLLVSDRPSSRCLLFDRETMRMIGWMNNATGEVRSPYCIDMEKCLKLAFSGIHVMSDRIFDALEEYVSAHGLALSDDAPAFPIMDFYVWACSRYDIRGVEARDMHLVDVGKLNTLAQAEEMVRSLSF